MKKFWWVIVCLMTMVVSVSSCSKDDDEGDLPYENEKSLSYDKSILLGTWKVSEVSGYYSEWTYTYLPDYKYIFYPDITDVKNWSIVFSPTYMVINLTYFEGKGKLSYEINNWVYSKGVISVPYIDVEEYREWESDSKLYGFILEPYKINTINIVSRNKIIVHWYSEEQGDETDLYLTFVKVSNNYDINPNVSYNY